MLAAGILTIAVIGGIALLSGVSAGSSQENINNEMSSGALAGQYDMHEKVGDILEEVKDTHVDDENKAQTDDISSTDTDITVKDTEITVQQPGTEIPSNSTTVQNTDEKTTSVSEEPEPVEEPDVIEEPEIPTETPIYQYYSDQDAIDIAKVLYNECRGIPSTTEKACVVWTILNRVDYYGSSVYSIIRSPNQFAFYEGTPVDSELLSLAYDVLERWSREKNGETDVGRVLPRDYMFFFGDGAHNYFRNSYSSPYTTWNYSLVSPYAS